MKKIILFLFFTLFIFQNTMSSFAEELKDEMYYKRQIQNQRFVYGTSGLLNAINKDRKDVVEAFVKAGYDMNDTWCGYPISFYALQKKRYDIFDMILAAGADSNARVSNKYSLLHFAIYYKDSKLVEILLKHNADVNLISAKKTPLNYAIGRKQTKIAEMLLNAGAKPDEKTKKLITKTKDEYLKSLFADYNWD